MKTIKTFITSSIWIMVSILCSLMVLGCASNGQGGKAVRGGSPYASPSENARDPQQAQRLTMEAAELIDRKPDRAEELLNQALTFDIYHGPAHNNLGVLHLKQGRFYEAANEFEWARKLMPGHPDPRMNLALTLEKAGRVDEAMATYDSALEVYPNHMPTMQALARLQIRRNRGDDRTVEMLKEIALAGQSVEWREWAQRQLVRARTSEGS